MNVDCHQQFTATHSLKRHEVIKTQPKKSQGH